MNNVLGARQFISDIDSRWNVLSEIADNRTNDEIGNKIFFVHLDIQMFLVIYLNQVEYLMISN